MEHAEQVHGRVIEGSSCPSGETLAAWLDGRLQPAEAQAIEAHVADCADCAELLATTGATLAGWDEVSGANDTPVAQPTASKPAHRPGRSLRTIFALAAMVTVVLGTLAVVRFQRLDADADVRALSAVQGQVRVTYGRLVAFGWAAPPRTFRAGSGTGSSDVPPMLDTAAGVEEKYRDDGRPEARHARGLALLLAGEIDRAVQELDEALAARPRDVRLLNDAAVAHLQRAWLQSDDTSLRLALDRLHQVVALDPASAEGWYNLAMAARLSADDELLRRASDTLDRIEPGSAWRADLAGR